MDTFLQVEDNDGIRFSWNLWPSTTAEGKQLVVPISCLYSPLKQSPDMPLVNFDPVQCPKCHALLNPYCELNPDSKYWTCIFCLNVASLPKHYSGITANELPAEIHPQSTTIEYALSSGASGLYPVFMFVVDISVPQAELDSLVGTLLSVLSTLPNHVYVGLVTFGSAVHVYELGFTSCPKIHIFDGSKEHTALQVKRTLQLGAPPTNKNNFILPLSAVDTHLTTILEELISDPHPSKPDERPFRCTGAALAVTLGVLESTFQYNGARVMLLCGGPGNYGPGNVIGLNKLEQMRSHSELEKEEAQYVHKASKYYTFLAEVAVKNSHVIDVFSCSLHQTGVLELQETFKQTGGCVILSESFQHKCFTESFKSIFKRDQKNFLSMGFDVKIELKTSKELAIAGGIGHLVSLNRKQNSHISKHEIGLGGTCEWKTCVIDPNSSFAFYFEVDNPKEPLPQGKLGMIQFKTYYTHPSGQRILRCTTVAHNWLPQNASVRDLLTGFDQEATAALVARQIIYKASTEECNIVRWLDNHLIQFCKRYANYIVESESSFSLPEELGMYPLFLFHLRRGTLVSSAGQVPDQTVFYRYYLLKESVTNILTMITPALDQYSFDSPEPKPMPLTKQSLKADCLLLLDTFFHTLVWSGPEIVAWREAGYHEKPEYENLRALMKAPSYDAKIICNNRFPRPFKLKCDPKDGAERYLKAVLDPEDSTSEDASFHRFMDHLKKYVVKDAQ